nr:proliferating cell nuclear antigen DNA polymerase sliding clamp [uncultured archaeon GZfos3D4]
MFEAKIDANVLRDCIEAITAVVDEGKLRIAEDGLKLRAVDPANVAMVSFELQSDAFDEFRFAAKEAGAEAAAAVESKAETEIGMDFVKLLGILGIGGREEVELELDEHAQKLFTRMGSLSYTISLLDPSSLRKEPKVPELEFPVRVIIETEEFRRTIRAAEKIGDHIVLGVDGEVFFMEAEGEMDKLRLGLRKEQLIDLTPGTLHSLYTLDYIAAMSKGMSHAENITLNLGKDYPLQIEFEMAEGKGKVGYLLAPRIESE